MDSIYFKEEHILLQKMVKDFAKNELSPIAQTIDSESQFPSESIKKITDLGLMGIPWDPKYGGGGMDTLSLVIVITLTTFAQMRHLYLNFINRYIEKIPEKTVLYLLL